MRGRAKPLGIVAGVALLAVAGALLYQAMSSSLVYFILPSDYASEPARYAERRLRLGGIVEEGTVSFNDQSLMLSFQITDSLQSYPVTHYGTPPQLFKENTGVVVEGTFREGVFSSDNLLVKHTEVYEPAEDGTISIDELRQTLQ